MLVFGRVSGILSANVYWDYIAKLNRLEEWMRIINCQNEKVA